MAEFHEKDPDFLPVYQVCINPLCRRKWKQLTPRSPPLFCPSCKKCVEYAVRQDSSSEEALLYNSMMYWEAVYESIVLITGSFSKAKKMNFGGKLGVNNSLSISDAVQAYSEAFPAGPNALDVRNWSSMGQRKKSMWGKVSCKCGRVCELKVPGYDQAYFLVDWRNEIIVGESLEFVAFPNPSVEERSAMPFVLKVLSDKVSVPSDKPSPVKKAQKSPSWRPPQPPQMRNLSASPGITNAGPAVAGFEDLLGWAENQPPAGVQGGKPKAPAPFRPQSSKLDPIVESPTNSHALGADLFSEAPLPDFDPDLLKTSEMLEALLQAAARNPLPETPGTSHATAKSPSVEGPGIIGDTASRRGDSFQPSPSPQVPQRRPDWIPDTPASPMYLHKDLEKSFFTPAPLQLLLQQQASLNLLNSFDSLQAVSQISWQDAQRWAAQIAASDVYKPQ